MVCKGSRVLGGLGVWEPFWLKPFWLKTISCSNVVLLVRTSSSFCILPPVRRVWSSFFFLEKTQLKTSGERTVSAENEKDQKPGSQEQGTLTAAASPLEEAIADDIVHRRRFTTC